MKIVFWPKSTAGKWAAILTLAFIVSMILKQITIGLLPLPTPVIAVLGVTGFIVGVISLIKNKERAIMTLVSIPIGLLIIIWTAAEIVFPH